MKRKKGWFFLFKLLVSCLFLTYLIYFVNWREVLSYLTKIQPIFIFLYIFFYILGIIISARKWQVLAKFKNFSHHLKFYVEVYLIGAFINSFLPSFIGGDSYRIFRLGEKDKNFKTSSSTVIVDRASGLFASFVLCIIFGLLNLKMFFYNLSQIFHIFKDFFIQKSSILLKSNFLTFLLFFTIFLFLILFFVMRKKLSSLDFKIIFLKFFNFVKSFKSFSEKRIFLVLWAILFFFIFLGWQWLTLFYFNQLECI